MLNRFEKINIQVSTHSYMQTYQAYQGQNHSGKNRKSHLYTPGNQLV